MSINKQVNDTNLKKKVNDLARPNRKRYLSFKLGNNQAEEKLEDILKPMVIPLKEIASPSSSIIKNIRTAPVKVEIKFKKRKARR